MNQEARVFVHEFSSTTDAYNACQTGIDFMTDNEVRTCDILVVPDEKVVGICDTWPVALTIDHGELHGCAEGYKLDDPNDANGTLVERIVNSHAQYCKDEAKAVSLEQARANIVEAKQLIKEKGWSIARYAK